MKKITISKSECGRKFVLVRSDSEATPGPIQDVFDTVNRDIAVEYVEMWKEKYGIEKVVDQARLFSARPIGVKLFKTESIASGETRFHFEDDGIEPRSFADARLWEGEVMISACTYDRSAPQYREVERLIGEHFLPFGSNPAQSATPRVFKIENGRAKSSGPLELVSVETVYGGYKRFNFLNVCKPAESFADAKVKGGELFVSAGTFDLFAENNAHARHLMAEYFELETARILSATTLASGGKKFTFFHGPDTESWAYANRHGVMTRSQLPLNDARRLTQARLITEHFKKAEAEETHSEPGSTPPPAPKAEEIEGAGVEVRVHKKTSMVEIFLDHYEDISDLDQRLESFKKCLGVGRRFSTFTYETPLFGRTLIMRCERGDHVTQGHAVAHIEAEVQKHFKNIPFEVKTVADFG